MEHLSFEEALAQLESLVKKLEEGRLPLDDAIQAFEQGAQLKKICEKKLQAAKMRVEKIVGVVDGDVHSEPFTV